MTCPVTEACFRVVSEYCYSFSKQFLYEDYKDKWEELRQRISKAEPTETTQRLRAFFCIELMYHTIFPAFEVTKELHVLQLEMRNVKFPRDHDGLTKLITLCEKVERNITVTHGELLLSGIELDALASHALKITDKPRSVAESCALASRALRPLLRGSTLGIHSVGTYLGYSLVVANSTIETCARYMHTMLDVTIHNPVSPWSMKSYQE